MAKKTQEQRILEYIEKFGSISTFQAFVDLGITRLASRIFDLSEKGYVFDRKQVETTNRFGEKTYYTRYSLARRPHEYTTVTRAEATPNFEEWKERIDT